MTELENILIRLRAGVDPDTKQPHITWDEAEAQILALIDKRETAARIDEFQKMINVQEDYEARLKADREKGIYPVSFGSANGAIANAGWLNYFQDRIEALSDKHSSKEEDKDNGDN